MTIYELVDKHYDARRDHGSKSRTALEADRMADKAIENRAKAAEATVKEETPNTSA